MANPLLTLMGERVHLEQYKLVVWLTKTLNRLNTTLIKSGVLNMSTVVLGWAKFISLLRKLMTTNIVNSTGRM